MTLRVLPIATETTQALRAGAPDANGQAPERAISDGSGNPCRHCLRFIPKGAEMLILCHRPFDGLQPYAESGPIFLCAEDCAPWQGPGLPPVLAAEGGARLIKGYSPEDRIVYGLGEVVAPPEISERVAAVLEDPRVAYVHIRSSTNNCFTCRVERD